MKEKIIMANPKIPSTKHKIHHLITERWSARSFADQTIGDSTIETLFEAASWSASSMNEQPWRYIYAKRGSQAFDRMVECLMDGNQPWAKNGSHLFISLAKRKFEHKGQANRHHMFDTGAANATLLMQAAQMDVFGHLMGGFHYDKALVAFDIDNEEYEIACFGVIGYLAAPDALPEPFKSRELTPRTRKVVNEFTTHLEE